MVARGDELRLGVAPGAETRLIDDLDCERVRCDVLERRTLRRALRGVERVFHAAGLRSLRAADAEPLFEINVGGTKAVLEECLRLAVERVVYTSSAAALGPAPPGGAADETQLFKAGRLESRT